MGEAANKCIKSVWCLLRTVWIISGGELDTMGLAFGYLLATSTSTYSWPWADFRSGPTRSMPTCLKGKLMMDTGISGPGASFCGAVLWHCGHCWMKVFTSATILGQWKQSWRFSSVLWALRSHPSGCVWARCMTVSILDQGMTTSFPTSVASVV